MSSQYWNHPTVWRRLALAAGGTGILTLPIWTTSTSTSTSTSSSSVSSEDSIKADCNHVQQPEGNLAFFLRSYLHLHHGKDLKNRYDDDSTNNVFHWHWIQNWTVPIKTTQMEPQAQAQAQTQTQIQAPEVLPANANANANVNSCASTSSSASTKEYDFVIIGNGIAGQSAVKTLQTLCPQATIAVLDPHAADAGADADAVPFASASAKTKRPSKKNNNNKNVHYYPTICTGFHPLTRNVQTSNASNADNANLSSLRYRHAVLVATGSRGAPPPHYLLDEKALERILEWKPTLQPVADHLSNTNTNTNTNTGDRAHRRRPIETPQQIRNKVLQAAKQGQSVAILGSGWDAVELAIAVAGVSNRSTKSSSTTNSTTNKKKKKTTKSTATTLLLFGAKGPLSHVLPQYLSAAVSKRLKATQKIQIQDRSLIRYIGSDIRSTQQDDDARLNLYTAKSYDLLDSGRDSCEWLVSKYLQCL